MLHLTEPDFHGEFPLPLIVTPRGDAKLTTHESDILELVESQLYRRGALLFRGFSVSGTSEFEHFVKGFHQELLTYDYQSSPRTHVSGHIYTSTEYPAHQTITLHNEMSYTTRWPMKIWFHCALTASSGGETPIADSRAVYQRIPRDVRRKFEQKKLLYVRNYSEGMDIPWQKTFQTQDKREVEAFCREAGIEWEWLNGDDLCTRQLCQAVARHPVSGEMVWFNQAHLFHVSNLDPRYREALLTICTPETLPRHVWFGDGSPIDEDDLQRIRQALTRCKVTFPWEQGDILMLDNMLVAHGRNPFRGDREVVVAMAEPYTASTR